MLLQLVNECSRGGNNGRLQVRANKGGCERMSQGLAVAVVRRPFGSQDLCAKGVEDRRLGGRGAHSCRVEQCRAYVLVTDDVPHVYSGDPGDRLAFTQARKRRISIAVEFGQGDLVTNRETRFLR